MTFKKQRQNLGKEIRKHTGLSLPVCMRLSKYIQSGTFSELLVNSHRPDILKDIEIGVLFFEDDFIPHSYMIKGKGEKSYLYKVR